MIFKAKRWSGYLAKLGFVLPMVGAGVPAYMVPQVAFAQSMQTSAQISQKHVSPVAPSGEITVTLLGTGAPEPRIDRFGPSTLVNVAGRNLLFDTGRGVIVRLLQAGISPGNLAQVFLTHYHSDHVNGLPDLWLTARLYGHRRGPMAITGPTGLADLARNMHATFANDIKVREADEHLPPAASTFDVTEFDHDGVVYDQDGITVTAFKVNHGALVHPAYGYRVDYNGHSVTLSGDTKYNENLISHAKATDLLVHEVTSAPPELPGTSKVAHEHEVSVLNHHTPPDDAGKVFTKVQPKLAVYSHIVTIHGPKRPEATDGDLIAATRGTYDGPLLVGSDLMVFEIGDDGVTQGFAADSQTSPFQL